MTTTQHLLDERYGRSAGSERRTRGILIGAAITLAVVLTAWVVWGGLSGTSATLETRELGYTDVTELEGGMEAWRDDGRTLLLPDQAGREQG